MGCSANAASSAAITRSSLEFQSRSIAPALIPDRLAMPWKLRLLNPASVSSCSVAPSRSRSRSGVGRKIPRAAHDELAEIAELRDVGPRRDRARREEEQRDERAERGDDRADDHGVTHRVHERGVRRVDDRLGRSRRDLAELFELAELLRDLRRAADRLRDRGAGLRALARRSRPAP